MFMMRRAFAPNRARASSSLSQWMPEAWCSPRSAGSAISPLLSRRPYHRPRYPLTAPRVKPVVEPYALAASLAFPRPYVITVHGTYGVVPLRGNPATRHLFSRTMRRAGAVACVSQFTRDRVNQALPLDNLVVINNGLELPDARADEGQQHAPIAGGPVLIGVGGLDRKSVV